MQLLVMRVNIPSPLEHPLTSVDDLQTALCHTVLGYILHDTCIEGVELAHGSADGTLTTALTGFPPWRRTDTSDALLRRPHNTNPALVNGSRVMEVSLTQNCNKHKKQLISSSGKHWGLQLWQLASRSRSPGISLNSLEFNIL